VVVVAATFKLTADRLQQDTDIREAEP